METRAFQVSSNGRTLTGYAATFNTPTRIADFDEVIRPGAFADSLNSDASGAITALYEHNPQNLLGRVGSGSLRLSEDATGLAFELDLPETQLGDDVLTLVKRGDLAGMSFGFLPTAEEWQGTTRFLNGVQLAEITLTANPAYASTSVGVRSRKPRLAVRSRYWEMLSHA